MILVKLGEENTLIIQFSYTSERVEVIRQLKNRKWHNDEKYWTAPLIEKNIKLLISHFQDNISFDSNLLPIVHRIVPSIIPEPNEILNKLQTSLKLKGYSAKTIKAYLSHISLFSRYLNKPLFEVTDEDIRHYMLYLLEEQHSSHAM